MTSHLAPATATLANVRASSVVRPKARAGAPGRHAPRWARGSATLGLVLTLLFAMTLGLAHAHRHTWFDLRIASQSLAASQTLAAAEAGLAWAQARLNDPSTVAADSPWRCGSGAGAASRARSMRHVMAPDVVDASHLALRVSPPPNAHWMCSWRASAAMECRCETGAATVGAGPIQDGTTSVAIQLERHATDPEALHVRARACLHARTPCHPHVATTSTTLADATAHASVVLKRTPVLAQWPAAPVVATGRVHACQGIALTNVEHTPTPAWRGALVHAGGAVQWSGTDAASAACPSSPGVQHRQTPGASGLDAVVALDGALASLLGSSSAIPTQHANLIATLTGFSPGVMQTRSCLIAGGSATERGERLAAASRRNAMPCQHFWVQGDLVLQDVGTLGSAEPSADAVGPLLIATNDRVRVVGNTALHGLVIQGTAASDAWAGGASLQGAWAVDGDVMQQARASLHYNLLALRHLAASGAYQKVPGSWTDQP